MVIYNVYFYVKYGVRSLSKREPVNYLLILTELSFLPPHACKIYITRRIAAGKINVFD